MEKGSIVADADNELWRAIRSLSLQDLCSPLNSSEESGEVGEPFRDDIQTKDKKYKNCNLKHFPAGFAHLCDEWIILYWIQDDGSGDAGKVWTGS